MNKFRRILSIFTVLTLFSLFSISPVLAEEESGPIDLGTGTEAPVVETVIDIPDADESVVETVVDIPDADESVVETVVDIPDADESVVETVIDIPDADESVVETIPEGPVTEEVPAETIPESPEYLNSDVLNVIVPVSVSITIDPLELAGKGQVYSNTYNIKNYGDTDVLLTFTDIQVTFAEGASIEPLAQPFDEGIGSELKSIFMMLDFGRSDVPPAIITDPNQTEEIVIPLSATQDEMADNSLVQLNFSGSVNEFSALEWHDNDVIITMNYTLVAVPPPVEEVTPAAIEVTPPAIETPPPAVETPPPAIETPPPAIETPPPAVETPPAEEATPESASPDPPAPSEMDQDMQESPSEPVT